MSMGKILLTALYLAFSFCAKAAANAYVSVSSSSGTVICDGLNFFVLPQLVGEVGNVSLTVSARPGWCLIDPDGGSGESSGGGSCHWTVVSEDGVNPEDRASGEIWVGEILIHNSPDRMLRQERLDASVSYSPAAIDNYISISVQSSDAEVEASLLDDGRKIRFERDRARGDVDVGVDGVTVAISVDHSGQDRGVNRGKSGDCDFPIKCRKELSFLSDALASDIYDAVSDEMQDVSESGYIEAYDFLTTRSYWNGDFFVTPVTPSIASRAAEYFSDNLANYCNEYVSESVATILTGESFSGVVLESWKWKLNVGFELNFAGGDVILFPPCPSMSWLNSLQNNGFTSEMFAFQGEKLSSSISIQNENAFGRFSLKCSSSAYFSHNCNSEVGSVLFGGEIKINVGF